MSAAVLYARISNDRTGAGLGVQRQLEDCRELAARRGMTVVAEYTDNDISAYSGKPRPGYNAAMEDLENLRATELIVWALDRLTRSPRDLESIVELCEATGATVRTVRAGDLDLATPSGRMVARMLGAAARHEVEHSIERQRRAKAQAAAEGRWRGGRRPFGYDVDGVTVRLDEARILRDATQGVVDGRSVASLAREFNETKVESTLGNTGHWGSNDIRRLLMRPRNAGLVESDGKVLGPALWPAVVDEPLWRACCMILTDPTRRTTPGPRRRWLGSGLYRCGVCDSPVTMHSPGSRGLSPAYRCVGHVSRTADPIDAYVTDLILARLSRPDVAAVLTDEPAVDITGLQLRSIEARRRLDDLAGEYAAGGVDARQLGIASRGLRSELHQVEEELAAAASRSPLMRKVAAAPAEEWALLELEQRRGVIDALAVVRLAPARKGRQSGGGYFDADSVDIAFT